ncbi:hypothetical protein [Halapricum hydrolyticum]|uniref:MSCRAMM family adhesin SdrC n=1 Tax=Halapricum hydrolyticum TaxID=2979991 RepID=A0AAE3LID6_9EURY|nr:hypothetical protein [Halapricum hydrolyticum]MCU4717241.1 MSCRAMM family adhesin SdrC [Halapricum hydrolyticum]MCU4726168.1 MSCRAMM family adhesin SdrC [Halapricum hydrolyticum]
MDRLASCYFCGDAVDAQLDEYSLVTSDRVETGRDIVLCPSCRQKLTTVIEEVLDAAIGGESIGSPAEVDLDDDPLETLEDPDEDVTTTSEGEQARSGHDESPSAEDTSTDETSASTGTDDASGDTGDMFGDADETSASDEGRGNSIESSGDARNGSERDEEGQATSDDGESAVTTADSDGRADAAGRESDDFERAEYNKVVRLLQNREFPVEIEEITVVARSAYGIDRDTTHTILEALIDRGILEDRGDELVRA